ncbi:hypothetical protein C2I36_09310 [Rhodobacteraceae bacterium WD3A24]|nr:hypothetical protein C2I36_09310 [Rhodobacteraceae bacterium WD3A24]
MLESCIKSAWRRRRPSGALVGAAALLALAGGAGAQTLADCDWVAAPGNIVEPWEENSRTYANGAIRVARLSTGGEPVCCSEHLLILHPSGEEEGPPYRACSVLSQERGLGWLRVHVQEIASSYDPAKGLLLQVPVGHYDGVAGEGRREVVGVRINQATGTATLE